LAIVILAIIFLPGQINQNQLIRSNEFTQRGNEVVGNAVQDASLELIQSKDNDSSYVKSLGNRVNFKTTELNLDAGLNQFYRTLYQNLNIEHDYSKQKAEKFKIPVKIAIGYDGYYTDIFESKKGGNPEKWSNKKTYSLLDTKNNIKINFTLDDYVYIQDLANNQKFEGQQSTFKSKYPHSCFGDETKFKEVKNRTILNLMKTELENSTYYNNYIAKKNGWKLNFDLKGGNRAFDSISFIAFVQNDELKIIQAYNSYGFGSAKITELKKFLGYERNGKKLYTSQKNREIDGNTIIFQTAKDAASAGYVPDPKYLN
jgi:hypothetical protein